LELERFMAESASLDLSSFIKQHPTPTLVFTPEQLAGAAHETLRVDTPGSRIMRLDLSADLMAGRLAILKTDDAQDEQEDLYATQSDDDDPPKTKKHQKRAPQERSPDDDSHAASGRVCKVTKGKRNPFEGIITIGRAGNNDIIIDNTTVSKVHAFITKAGRQWRITDQDSTNKTYVNGVVLKGKKSHPLVDNDKLGFGRESFATFFMPEGLWRFIRLCNSLNRRAEPVAPQRKRRTS